MKISSKFGKKIAKVMINLKSSHCYFILQMAYGEELFWEDAEELMKKVIKEK
jgi:hypothetical protein